MSASRKMRELNRARIEHDKSRLMAGFAESRKEMVNMVDAALAGKVEALTQQLASRDAEIATLYATVQQAHDALQRLWDESNLEPIPYVQEALAATEPKT